MKNNYFLKTAAFALFTLVMAGTATFAQTPPEFTYQGSLKDGANPANGNYDFEIKLYSAPTGSALIGTRTRLNVPVTNGVFTVKLDFAGAAFNGEDRFLEIGVRLAGGGGYQQLLPRQPINHVPYSIRSVQANQADTATTATDALSLGGVAANQYVFTTDPRMTDARNPLAGSGNYIQRDPANAQSGGFNIIGRGSAGTFDVITNYQIGGNRVLGVPGTNNVFVGVNAGNANTTGEDNTFVGRGAGIDNAGGSRNSFFGSATGQDNVTGIGNAFFGFEAGANSTADFNSFFGSQAGQSDTTGERNSFFGNSAGAANTGGSSNSFFGQRAGNSNLNGDDNSFFGREAGFSNTGGNRNSFFGRDAGRSNVGGIGNVFFGFAAAKNNTADFNTFVGANAGVVNGNGTENVFVGNSAGLANTGGNDNTFVGKNAGAMNTSGFRNVFIGKFAGNSNTAGNHNTVIGYGADVQEGVSPLHFATAIGAGAVALSSDSIVLGRPGGADRVYINGDLSVDGTLYANFFVNLNFLAPSGSRALCLNASGTIANCSSSLRYKTNVQTFLGGLDFVSRLRPVTFNWKEGGMADLGLGAEDVEKIEPLLVTYNKSGQVEGVKYDRIGVVMINAIKEQQAQIENQKAEIENLKKRLEAVEGLKKLVCAATPTAAVCSIVQERKENE
jgi:hypothetical protein